VYVTCSNTVLWVFPSVCSVFCDYTFGGRKTLNVINKYIISIFVYFMKYMITVIIFWWVNFCYDMLSLWSTRYLCM